MSPSPDRPAEPPASRTPQLAVTLAALAVGLAVKVDGGNFDPRHPVTIGLLAVAVVAGLIATLGARVRLAESVGGGRLVCGTLALAIAGSAVALCVGRVVPPSARAADSSPASATPQAAPAGETPMHAILTLCGFPPPTDGPGSAVPVRLLLLAAAAAGLVAVAGSLMGGRAVANAMRRNPSPALKWTRAVAMPVALALHLAGLVAAVRAAPAPVMDVLVFQAVSTGSLMSGTDPYAVRFPDLSGGTSPHYGPGLQDRGELLFGYPYPPLSLYPLVPAWLAGGAVQYAHAAAFTLSAALIAYAGRGPVARLAAVLFMLTPTGPLVVCYGWTETLVAPFLALTVFAACPARGRPPSATPTPLGIGLGLFWAAKQYVPLTAPLAWLLVGRPEQNAGRVRVAVVAVVTAAAVTLPLVLWDLPAFWHSAVAVQFRQPFRPDALSFAAAFYHWAGAAPPAWVAFVALAAVQALALWRSPRTPAGFAAATGTALLVFFAFNKQAFAGYYFLVSAAYACALAASGGELDGQPAPTRPVETPSSPTTTAPSRRTSKSRRTGKSSRHPHAGV